MRHARADYQGIQDWPHKRPHVTTSIGIDEPVFLVRAKDILMPRVLSHYMEEVLHLPSHMRDDKMVHSLQDHLDRVHAWQREHFDIVKYPTMPDANAVQWAQEATRDIAPTEHQIDVIASICHEANRRLQILQWVADMPGVTPSMYWDIEPEWQKESVRHGVVGIMQGLSPEGSHESWMQEKASQGWVYGPVKDVNAKTHPCMVPYSELPLSQQFKDHLFAGIVKTCLQAIGDNPSWPYDPRKEEEENMALFPNANSGLNQYSDQTNVQQQNANHPPKDPADGGITNDEVLNTADMEDQGEDFTDDISE